MYPSLAWRMRALRDLLLTRAQVRVKCNADDTIGDLKKLIAAQVCVWHTLRRRLQKHPVACAQNSGWLRDRTAPFSFSRRVMPCNGRMESGPQSQ